MQTALHTWRCSALSSTFWHSLCLRLSAALKRQLTMQNQWQMTTITHSYQQWQQLHPQQQYVISFICNNASDYLVIGQSSKLFSNPTYNLDSNPIVWVTVRCDRPTSGLEVLSNEMPTMFAIFHLKLNGIFSQVIFSIQLLLKCI